MFSRNEITDPHSKPLRIRYPWWELEEFLPDGGMWGIAPTHRHEHLMDQAETLMVRTDDFRDAMRMAVEEWPRSVSVALTTPGLNQRAWLGHAGTYIATGCPEDLTRIAWHRLDSAEQHAANDAAETVISEWHKYHSPTPTRELVQEGLW